MRVGNDPVDLSKWLKAEEKNPQRNVLGVTQLNSVAEVRDRAKLVLESMQKTKKRMALVTEQMHNLHKQCDEDLHIKLQRAYESNQ